MLAGPHPRCARRFGARRLGRLELAAGSLAAARPNGHKATTQGPYLRRRGGRFHNPLQNQKLTRRASPAGAPGRPENVSCRDGGFAMVHLTMTNRSLPLALAAPVSRSSCSCPGAEAAARPAAHRPGVHRAHPEAPAGSADHHGAGRSPPGVRDRALAPQVLRPHRRHAWRADVREGHPPLLPGAGGRVASGRATGRSAPPRRAATSSCSRSPTKRRSRRSTSTATRFRR